VVGSNSASSRPSARLRATVVFVRRPRASKSERSRLVVDRPASAAASTSRRIASAQTRICSAGLDSPNSSTRPVSANRGRASNTERTKVSTTSGSCSTHAHPLPDLINWTRARLAGTPPKPGCVTIRRKSLPRELYKAAATLAATVTNSESYEDPRFTITRGRERTAQRDNMLGTDLGDRYGSPRGTSGTVKATIEEVANRLSTRETQTSSGFFWRRRRCSEPPW
jgi:hypothetical protein